MNSISLVQLHNLPTRTTMIIKKTIFHPHIWMDDLSYHLISLEVYSITTLNARCHFVSQMTLSFNKNRLSGHLLQVKMRHVAIMNPNSSTKTNVMGKVKSLSLIG